MVKSDLQQSGIKLSHGLNHPLDGQNQDFYYFFWGKTPPWQSILTIYWMVWARKSTGPLFLSKGLSSSSTIPG